MPDTWPMTLVIEHLPGFFENQQTTGRWGQQKAIAAQIRQGRVIQIQTHFPDRQTAQRVTGSPAK